MYELEIIRLELARTENNPQGSPAHAHVLLLAVDDNGLLKEQILRHPDKRPVVRRFWPGEADLEGVVVPKVRGWVFSYEPGDNDDEALFHPEDHPIRVGEYLTITEPDGEKLPFKVVSCHD